MAPKREPYAKGKNIERAPDKQSGKDRLNIMSKTPMAREKYGDMTPYIFKSDEVILPLEFEDS